MRGGTEIFLMDQELKYYHQIDQDHGLGGAANLASNAECNPH